MVAGEGLAQGQRRPVGFLRWPRAVGELFVVQVRQAELGPGQVGLVFGDRRVVWTKAVWIRRASWSGGSASPGRPVAEYREPRL